MRIHPTPIIAIPRYGSVVHSHHDVCVFSPKTRGPYGGDPTWLVGYYEHSRQQVGRRWFDALRNCWVAP